MYIASDLLIFSFGFTMLKFISCHSDGSLLGDQCNVTVINIMHNDLLLPQTTEAPFKVDWTPEENETIKVTLSATSDTFKGFMLDFRNCVGTFSLVAQDNNELICGDRVMIQSNNLRKTSVSGLWTPESARQCLFRTVFLKDFATFWEKVFTLPSTTPPPTDTPTYSHSQTTTDTPTTPPTPEANSANQTTSPKINSDTPTTPPTPEANSANPTTSPKINLDTPTTPPTPEANSANPTTSPKINLDTPTTPPTPEANSANPTTSSKINSDTPTTPPTPEANSANPTTSPKINSVTPQSPQCVQYLRCILALLLFSRMCFLGGSPLLIIIRPDLKKKAILNPSVLELACKTVAVILVLIKTNKYECVHKCAGVRTVFTALTVAAMVSSLLHTITVSLRCGPSHELRKYWLYAIIMVDLMNTIITTTAIIFPTWCFEERWLPILMGVYVVWEILLYLGLVCFEQMEKYQTRKNVGNQNHILDKKISPRFFMFIIFTVFNVMLTIALMTGVSLVRIMN